MEKMDKGLTVSKWVLINCPKKTKMPQKLSAQIVCPSPKVWDFDEKRLHWASVVRAFAYLITCTALYKKQTKTDWIAKIVWEISKNATIL